MQHLTLRADLAVIFKWVKNSSKPPHPSHSVSQLVLLDLFYSRLTALFLSVTVFRHRGHARQTGRKRFPGLPRRAGQLCCLPLWAGLELHQTGNLRVALVIQPSHCLIPHKQTPTPPTHTHIHAHAQLPPHPLCLQPTTRFSISCSHWSDSGSLTTPPSVDRLAAVPFPGWPRARHSGIWSPEISFNLLCSLSRGLRVPALSAPSAPPFYFQSLL